MLTHPANSRQDEHGAPDYSTAALLPLVEQSRCAATREAFAATGKPRTLALALPGAAAEYLTQRSDAAAERLLTLLRVLRNLCAGVEAAKDQLHEAGACAQLALLLANVAAEPALASRGLLLATALQALGNACVLHPRNQAAAWCVRLAGEGRAHAASTPCVLA